jgi:hypothetical protein
MVSWYSSAAAIRPQNRKADIRTLPGNVRTLPKADKLNNCFSPHYSVGVFKQIF